MIERMLNESESAELRMLQVKAYGRDGGLSVAELERLRDLESRRADSLAHASCSGEADSSGDAVRSGEADSSGNAVRSGDADPARQNDALQDDPLQDDPRQDDSRQDDSRQDDPRQDDPRQDDPWQDDPWQDDPNGEVDPQRVVERAAGETKRAERAERVEADSPGDQIPHGALRRWRRHPLFFGAAASIALALGLGIGWGIWGWDADTYALASAHAEQGALIEASDDFDAGTVAPLAEQYGVVVWRAERSDGDEVCVIVTGPDELMQHGCTPAEELKESVWPNATATVPEGEEKSGQQLVAGLLPTMTGELVPYIQVWDQDGSDWESQYSDAELSQLEELEAAGYDSRSLGVIGYDGDTVVWSNWASSGFCVIAAVDGGPIEACTEDATSDVTLTLDVVVNGVATEYVVRQSEMRGPQLTIVRHPDAAELEIDPEADDPIEFTFDDPTFDDLVTDGETGETPG